MKRLLNMAVSQVYFKCNETCEEWEEHDRAVKIEGCVASSWKEHQGGQKQKEPG